MEINCRCQTSCARIRGGLLIIEPHGGAHPAEIDLRDILAAAAADESSLYILRDFYDENETVNFIVK